MSDATLTLLQLNQLIARLMVVPQTQNVWVTAELSDVAVRGGHCYMELLQKDDCGVQQAKARGVIWASSYHRLAAEFYAATGQRFATGLKLMVKASATMHPVYGMSLVISAINPEYTMGDLIRRRQEILRRLKNEGIIDMNRSLPWPETALKIAVISAPGAAGYGDFINQLYGNQSKLRFATRLFPAIMQGERAPSSIIAAMEQVVSMADSWDCVVIIRGGGATSDLQAFEDYELAAAVAQFPLPVIIGIGHERDVTVLDYVANMRVKTPTAAAEWLVGRAEESLGELRSLGARILQAATDAIAAHRERLSYLEAALPIAPVNAIKQADNRLRRAAMGLSEISSRRVAPALERVGMMGENLRSAIELVLVRRRDRLDNYEKLLRALSPRAVLSRGYTISRVAGHAISSVADLSKGKTITTIFADGTARSVIADVDPSDSPDNK